MSIALRRLLLPSFALAALLAAAGCPDSGDFRDAGSTRGDGAALDAPSGSDSGDLTHFTDGARRDGAHRDAGGDGARADTRGEGGPAPDSSADSGPAPDSSADHGPPADSTADATHDSGTNPTGLSVPCAHGAGWTVLRFHYDSGSTSARIDVWDATCSYSFAPNSACNVREVYPGFGSVSRTSQGYPILTTSEYLRVRFSVSGLSFTKATVYVQARSYATASSTTFRVWSPLYGDAQGGPVDNDFIYDWYGVNWTGYLYPSDAPALTAIQIYAYQGSGKLAVRSVELCVSP